MAGDGRAAQAGWLRTLSDGVARLETVLCGALIIGFTALILTNVTLRYLFSAPLYYAEETAVLIMVWMAFLATSMAVKNRALVAVTLLVEALPARTRRVVQTVADLLVIACLAVLVYAALWWMGSPSMRYERAITLDLPKWPFFAIVPVTFAAMILHAVQNLLEDLRGEAHPHDISEELRVE
jgi:TRAP-type C4-dicarboxylate transport system permease small subunit